MRYAGIISFLLLLTLISYSPLCPMAPAQASRGNVLVDAVDPPSSVVTVQIGESVSLYFGHVIWSGAQVDLYLSGDGFASLSVPGDVRYGPTFSVAKIMSSLVDTTTYEGYTVGKDWINGTIPKTVLVPAGSYYVKAFDGSSSAVAVTDNWIRITA